MDDIQERFVKRQRQDLPDALDQDLGQDVSSETLQTFGVVYSGTRPLSLIFITDLLPEPSTVLVTRSISAQTSESTPEASETPLSASVEAQSDSNGSEDTTTLSAGDAPSGGNSKGLVAGIAVLAVLLAVSIGAILWLLYRKRRKAPTEEYPAYTAEAKSPTLPPKANFLKTEYDVSGHASRDISVTSLENHIAKLEADLQGKDTELRSAHAALSAKRSSVVALSDTQIRTRFAKIVDEIESWVDSGFSSFTPASSLTPELVARLQQISPEYNQLLRDPATRAIVVRALVADVIAQAFVTEQFIGDVTFAELKSTMRGSSSTRDFNEWRALTVRVLSKTSSFRADRETTVEDVAKKVHYLIMSLTGAKRFKKHLQHLTFIVNEAAELALDLAKQRALIQVERSRGEREGFFGDRMELAVDEDGEDAFEKNGGQSREGRGVRLFVFPAVVRYGNDAGIGYETGEVVCRAKVLV